MTIAFLAALAFAASPPQDAQPRQAQCVVKGNGAEEYRGPCLFHAGERGSFTVAGPRRRSLGGANSISLYMVRRNVGEVRGITREGVNSRWGRAVRSRRDPACWAGADFSLCVY